MIRRKKVDAFNNNEIIQYLYNNSIVIRVKNPNSLWLFGIITNENADVQIEN